MWYVQDESGNKYNCADIYIHKILNGIDYATCKLNQPIDINKKVIIFFKDIKIMIGIVTSYSQQDDGFYLIKIHEPAWLLQYKLAIYNSKLVFNIEGKSVDEIIDIFLSKTGFINSTHNTTTIDTISVAYSNVFSAIKRLINDYLGTNFKFDGYALRFGKAFGNATLLKILKITTETTSEDTHINQIVVFGNAEYIFGKYSDGGTKTVVYKYPPAMTQKECEAVAKNLYLYLNTKDIRITAKCSIQGLEVGYNTTVNGGTYLITEIEYYPYYMLVYLASQKTRLLDRYGKDLIRYTGTVKIDAATTITTPGNDIKFSKSEPTYYYFNIGDKSIISKCVLHIGLEPMQIDSINIEYATGGDYEAYSQQIDVGSTITGGSSKQYIIKFDNFTEDHNSFLTIIYLSCHGDSDINITLTDETLTESSVSFNVKSTEYGTVISIPCIVTATGKYTEWYLTLKPSSDITIDDIYAVVFGFGKVSIIANSSDYTTKDIYPSDFDVLVNGNKIATVAGGKQESYEWDITEYIQDGKNVVEFVPHTDSTPGIIVASVEYNSTATTPPAGTVNNEDGSGTELYITSDAYSKGYNDAMATTTYPGDEVPSVNLIYNPPSDDKLDYDTGYRDGMYHWLIINCGDPYSIGFEAEYGTYSQDGTAYVGCGDLPIIPIIIMDITDSMHPAHEAASAWEKLSDQGCIDGCRSAYEQCIANIPSDAPSGYCPPC